MIKIMGLEQAQKTILRRQPLAATALPEAVLAAIEKIFGKGMGPAEAVARILTEVREHGDAALRSWSEKLDHWTGDRFAIAPGQLSAALAALPVENQKALAFAAHRIRKFHQGQPLPEWQTRRYGGVVGHRVTPIDRVGIYVPGGSAPLPSSLLMCAIPAQVAGVREILVCTPPPAHPAILAAAEICKIKHVYQIGGAQAIAAMAFGTETLPKVDKIVGAGNLFVALAKQQLYGVVGMDGLAGPTETLIIADDNAHPEWIAADLCAQAEHDPMATAILLTPSLPLARQVRGHLQAQIQVLPRHQIIRQSISQRGGIVVTSDLETAVQAANAFAPEHLCLAVKAPEVLAQQVKHAGGIFLGESSPEVLGDYVAGPSHVMPTGGTARFASPLNVLDFVKITSIVGVDRQTSLQLCPAAATIAAMESLQAHANAARVRLGEGHA